MKLVSGKENPSAARRDTALLGALALCFTGLAVADPIFHWVDDDGVAHYSDSAPGDVEGVTTLVLNAKNPPDYDPADDPYSIRNQAERTSETWKELEARRADRREKREAAETREREDNRQVDYWPYPYTTRSWYYPPYYRPIRPPEHRPPHVRPPIYPPRPAWPVKSTSEWTDPMRSAHIGVRRSPPPNSPK